ncbi:hypothetical protein HPP92_024897 [Vanilla planifolia]|uniref:Uncharacterized protein n=1 Tax=Vanilla planifolia TaxID=51239 RepID=A0A835UBZ0_VANPL|nr:hypothetical protein HPP92_024897 [Vanilla planifolia]
MQEADALYHLFSGASGCFLMIHFISHAREKDGQSRFRLSNRIITQLFEEIEEENFHLPPPRGRRNPRAFRRKGPRKPPSVIDEFLDESSELRLWLDMDGNPFKHMEVAFCLMKGRRHTTGMEKIKMDQPTILILKELHRLTSLG